MNGHVLSVCLLACAALLAADVNLEKNRQATAFARGVADVEFVFETAPFASAHASTIVETREGIVAAWFAGTREGAADVGVWLSRRVNGAWTRPIEVAT